MGFLFWVEGANRKSLPKGSRHLSRNRELFEQFSKPSPGLRARLSQRESVVKDPFFNGLLSIDRYALISFISSAD
jgi:hypothetical protein